MSLIVTFILTGVGAQTIGGEILYTTEPMEASFFSSALASAMQFQVPEPSRITAVTIWPRVTQPCDFRLHFWDSELSAASPGQQSSLISLTVANDDQEVEATMDWTAAPNTNLYVGISPASQTGCIFPTLTLRTATNGVLYQNDGTGRWAAAPTATTDPFFIRVEGIREIGTTEPPTTPGEGTGGIPPLSPFFFGLSLAFFSMAVTEGTAGTIRAIVAIVLFFVGVVFWTSIVGGG
jgi:hypothetical protein